MVLDAFGEAEIVAKVIKRGSVASRIRTQVKKENYKFMYSLSEDDKDTLGECYVVDLDSNALVMSGSLLSIARRFSVLRDYEVIE